MGASSLGASHFAKVPHAPRCPHMGAYCNSLHWLALDKKKAGTLDFIGFTGLYWTCLDR